MKKSASMSISLLLSAAALSRVPFEINKSFLRFVAIESALCAGWRTVFLKWPSYATRSGAYSTAAIASAVPTYNTD